MPLIIAIVLAIPMLIWMTEPKKQKTIEELTEHIRLVKAQLADDRAHRANTLNN